MKTIYLVFDKQSHHVVGAYSSSDELQFEVLVNGCINVYDINNIYVKKEENVSDEVYERLIEIYKRKGVWN